MSYGQGASTMLSMIKMGLDLQEQKKLKKEAEEQERTRPKIQRDANADYNLNLTESELANGMSARAEKAYNDANDRQFSSSLGAILRGGGDVNSVGAIYGAGEDGRLKLAMMRDSNRLNQISNVLNQSKYVDERNYVTPWQVNIDQPWRDKTSAIAEARRQNAANVERDWGTVTSSLSGMGADSSLKDDTTKTTTTQATGASALGGASGYMSGGSIAGFAGG